MNYDVLAFYGEGGAAMLHVINAKNRHLYEDTLEQMFRLRHKVFVEGKGWKRLERESKLEIDQFDNEEAIYFLKLHANGDILGGMRLVPTTAKTQLKTVFKQWCTFESPPESKSEWEWSRYFVTDKGFRSSAGFPVFYELFFGILEYAVHHHIAGLSGFLEAHTLPRLSRLPWELRFLGPIVTYGKTHGETEGKGAPVRVSVNPKMLRVTKRIKGMAEKYFAIPLGPETSVAHKAYDPVTCFQYLDFIDEHPEYATRLAQFVDMFGDNGSLELLDDICVRENTSGFEPRTSDLTNTNHISSGSLNMLPN